MQIRKAGLHDLVELQRIYAAGRKTMIECGNTAQWAGGYPQDELLKQDIAQGQLFIVEEDGKPCAAFMFAVGDDPTYEVIEEGTWIGSGPYGVIHRIASDGTLRGILGIALQYAFEQIDDVRIDTHADNVIMRHLLDKAGFTYCGVIYCHDGTARVAYEKLAG